MWRSYRESCPWLAGTLLLSLTVFMVPFAATQPPGAKGPNELPISGKAGPGLESLDEAVINIMERHGIPGASLAIAKDGKLVFAKGFGWAHIAIGLPVTPETLFALASISKPITALAILKLIEEGKLKLDEPAFAYIANIRPPRGSRVDPRLGKITIRQLLNHSGGWDRNKSGDPINWAPQISRRLGVPMPPSTDQFLSFLLGVPLDFTPGTREVYANAGYVVLGRIVEKVTGQTYETYVRKNVLEPMGIRTARTHKGEKIYYEGESGRYLPGTSNLLPPLQMPMLEPAGGWSASTVDLVKLSTALDGSRGKMFLKEETFESMMAPPPPPLKVRANGTYPGLGFYLVKASDEGLTYSMNGSWHGARAFMKRTPKKINWALAFNASMDPDAIDVNLVKDAVHKVRETVEAIRDYPNVDFFKEFP